MSVQTFLWPNNRFLEVNTQDGIAGPHGSCGFYILSSPVVSMDFRGVLSVELTLLFFGPIIYHHSSIFKLFLILGKLSLSLNLTNMDAGSAPQQHRVWQGLEIKCGAWSVSSGHC